MFVQMAIFDMWKHYWPDPQVEARANEKKKKKDKEKPRVRVNAEKLGDDCAPLIMDGKVLAVHSGASFVTVCSRWSVLRTFVQP